ncbi:MAG: winged helix-turn-helix domain-containing protein [Candidatus Peregrinibacteria bacterium]
MNKNAFGTKTQSEAEALLKTVQRSSEMRRVQCIFFRCFGSDSISIARMVGYKPSHVRLVWQWFRGGGWDRLLGERRGRNRGRAHLEPEKEAEFLESFKVKSEKGSLVTVSQIHKAHAELLEKDLDPTVTYRLLERHGWRKIAPRPEHPKHDREAMKHFRGAIFPPGYDPYGD